MLNEESTLESTRTAAPIPLVAKYFIGLPRPLIFGYIAVLLFLVGDGVESNYLAPFLTGRGLTVTTTGAIISVYGIFVTIGSWLSGVLSTRYGPRRIMRVGAVIWVVFEVLFLAVAIPSHLTPLIFVFYGLRGLGYPFFAYSFLLWIQLAAKPEKQGVASGWFWFAYTAGIPTLGSAIAAVTIPLIGAFGTLWLSLVIVAIGGVIGSFVVRELHGRRPIARIEEDGSATAIGEQLLAGITILRRRPRLAAAAVVRIINNAPMFGFFVFLPAFFTDRVGWTQSQYLLLVTIMGLVGLIVDPFMGRFADTFGWRRTIAWIGGVGCAVMGMGIYFVPPLFPSAIWVGFLFGGLFGAFQAGFIPLTAVMTSMAGEKEKGNGFAIYSLAAGLCTFIGPALFTVLDPLVGTTGVVLVYAALFLLATVLTLTLLRVPQDPGEKRRVAARAALEPETALSR
ncbi:hypothetical protein AX769_08475 [Frondihabitans sp. PAMC 28766]|uniref:MFS transporter n=1 Tax=Frondihabitans sp. PAMC 28766 TaxID=1795630 RepID=UPI00078BDEBB|nr:MFS transporter [Frondihabitans sp. PAMC 28766]AMM20193.1 hypothetical protein AX769_08475 [Frondihabitans sp. PAMC 28766]